MESIAMRQLFRNRIKLLYACQGAKSSLLLLLQATTFCLCYFVCERIAFASPKSDILVQKGHYMTEKVRIVKIQPMRLEHNRQKAKLQNLQSTKIGYNYVPMIRNNVSMIGIIAGSVSLLLICFVCVMYFRNKRINNKLRHQLTLEKHNIEYGHTILHELQTGLTRLLGKLKGVSAIIEPQSLKDELQHIYNHTNRMQQLITEYTEYSRQVGEAENKLSPKTGKISSVIYDLRDALMSLIQSDHLRESFHGNKDFASNDQLLQHLQEFIIANISNDELGIDDLCREVGLSRTQLYRKLKAKTGSSASHYIRETRLSHACNLLKQKDINVSQVAFQCGFSTHSHFSKCFYEKYGMTPTDFKTR